MSEEARRADLAASKIEFAQRLLALYSIPDPELRKQAMACDAYTCANDFFYWCNRYGWVLNPKLAVDYPDLAETPFVLWPSQTLAAEFLFRQLEAGEPALMPKSREIGVTWLVMHITYWLWRFRRGNTRLVSRIEDLVDKKEDPDSLFEKIRFIHRHQPPHLRERRVRATHMLMKNLRSGSVVSGSATGEDAGRGGRSQLAVVDEYATIEPSVARALQSSLAGNARSTWYIYNPKGTQHPSYDLFKSLAPHQVMSMDWQRDPYRDEGFPKTMLRFPLGSGIMTKAEFAREFECSHAAVLSGLIWECNEARVTYSDDDMPAPGASEARRTWQHVGGWDFGSGPSDLVCLFALAQDGGSQMPTIWVDDELVWSRERWYDAGSQAALVGGVYRGPAIHFGDPAGENKESDQQSWASNLRSCGLPLQCLPSYYNTADGKDWAIKLVQLLLDEGKLHIHRRCRSALASITGWRWNVPDGVDPRVFARARIGPRHDELSHPGMALLYLVGGTVASWLAARGRAEEDGGGAAPRRPLPVQQIHEVLRNARRAA